MARQRFRLATLLRLREATRDDCRARLAEAFRAADSIRRQIDEIDRELADTRRRETAPLGKVEVDALVDAHRYELVLTVERRELQRQANLVDQEVEKRRQTLVAADAEVKTLERLRETQRQRLLLEEGRREVKTLDEVAARGWREHGGEDA